MKRGKRYKKASDGVGGEELYSLGVAVEKVKQVATDTG